jgi:hypothetical protein
MLPSTFALALAVVAALIVAGVSLMYAVSAISISKSVRTAWETSKPAKVAAEVEGLREELLVHKRLMRSELGRVWYRMPRRGEHAEPDGDMGPSRHQVVNGDDVDPELAAELALQRSPAKGP